jgi:hypothetical protein
VRVPTVAMEFEDLVGAALRHEAVEVPTVIDRFFFKSPGQAHTAFSLEDVLADVQATERVMRGRHNA